MSVKILRQEERNQSPEYSVSWINRATYHYLQEIFSKGYKTPLEMDDLYKLDPENESVSIEKKFQEAWDRQQHRSGPIAKVFFAFSTAFGRDFYLAGVYLLIYNILNAVTPIVLQMLLQWLENPNDQIWIPYCLGVLLFALQLWAAFIYNWQYELAAKSGYRLRTGLSAALYQKFFKLSLASKQAFSVGKIVNIATTDTTRLDLTMQFVHMAWTSPVLIIIVCVILYLYLGVSVFAGFGFIILYLPLQWYLTKLLSRFRRAANLHADKRMKIIHEALKGIRVIKAYAWENSFLKLIFGIRKDEVKYVRNFLATRASTSSLTQNVPAFALIVTLVTFSLLGNELTASRILPSLALFYALRVPMLFLPIAIGLMIDAWIAAERAGSLLDAEELTNQPEFCESSNDVGLEVTSATFQWDNADPSLDAQNYTLENINLTILKGQLVGIVGAVGAGKSSLLQGLIGDMPRTQGNVVFYGSVGYCQQQAWVQNSTLRDNILFGLPFDQERYKKVIKACALERDLAILAGGDLTEIGEQGINLSGGQKQRLSLARAVYSNPDVILFDDPLSAVDAHVGKHLFEKCIKDALKGKTRVLVTHQLHFISQVDWIIVMDHGKIVGQGTFNDLLASSEYFSTLMASYHGTDDLEETELVETPSKKENVIVPKAVSKESLNENTNTEGQILMTKEERATGNVKGDIVQKYTKFAGGWIVILLFALWIVTANSSRIATDQWLIFWIGKVVNISNNEYMTYYAILGIAQLLFTLFYGFSVAYFGAKASYELHNQALLSLLKSPVSFFDSTPLGRITSRFSRDIDTLDTILPESIRAFFWTLAMCVFNLLLISYFLPIFLAPAAIAVVFYYIVQIYYRSTSRELKRIDSIARSPVIALISETLIGLTTIRSFNAADRFIERFKSFVDFNNRPLYMIILTQRWIQLRLELLNSTLVLISTLFSIAFRNQVSVGTTGILIAYALQVTQTFSWTIKTGTDVETYLNCAERMIFYVQDIETEKPAIVESHRPPQNWPSKGHVSIRDLCLRYRSDLPLVLQSIKVEIEPGSKVGIVGRTGAGKSTILTALLRIVEHDSGSIWIDGLNISELGLEDLRSRIAVIPQEPILFSGTLRFNLDPFFNYTDDLLWDVLRRANLYDTVQLLGTGLDSTVTENGDNWSTGQRQLICLARAMLKNSKIILLDEATASVDFVTDEFIQNAIRKDFADATVITIAHRLNTVADYDKIMVMSFGKVIEYNSPRILLESDSEFSKMVKETGDVNQSVIRSIAFKK